MSVIAPSGFREYDARWRTPQEIDAGGMARVGTALDAMLRKRGDTGQLHIVVGYDYRSYNAALAEALMEGLMRAGAHVHDIGLCLSPTAYFAQEALGVPAVAMVTASHNPNGWTGVKMGAQPPLTFGPDEMTELKETVATGACVRIAGGRHEAHPDIAARYRDDLVAQVRLTRRLKIVLSCGNGTAGKFAPDVFERAGADIVPLDCTLDDTFPKHMPNPEDMRMMRALGDEVRVQGADLGLAFDGDGDRCGFVDETGAVVFADKVGLLLARHFARAHKGARFVVDVKSTGLFADDALFQVDYWKTGHSHMKRRVYETGALAGFEKSGHMFFAPPLGRIYDDGLLAGLRVSEMLCAGTQTLGELAGALPASWMSPTLSPSCADALKYDVVARVACEIEARGAFGGRAIRDILTINGVRAVLEDGSFILVRASSNVPRLVVVVESRRSEADMRALFGEVDTILKTIPDIGDYDQKL